MKKVYLLLSLALLVFFFTAAYFINAKAPTYSTSFTYKVTSTAVITKVTYNPDLAPLVEKYIDSCFKPVIVFGDKHKNSKEVTISADQKYFIKGAPGSLTMTAYKAANSSSSLSSLKTIWEGLKSVIKPN